MKVIYLKIYPQYFKDVIYENKTFEVRKNDREYEVGDFLVLREFDPDTKTYTGRGTVVQIKYILSDENYVLPGYIIMGIKKNSHRFTDFV